MHKIALAMFVKTPGFSPVKTRLAASLGTDAATNLYIRSIKAIEETVTMAKSISADLHPVWAVAEPAALDNPLWAHFEQLGQESGDLGDRLSNIHDQISSRFRSWIFIGADSPQLPHSLFVYVATLLRSTQPIIVVGPARDGGFYLFGSNVNLDPNIWRGLQYSSDTTLGQLLLRLPKDVPVTMLPTEQDMDTQQDLWAIQSSLSKATLITASQKELFECISAYTTICRGVLFLCVANSARSQMAQGIARRLLPATLNVESAGSEPTRVNSLAIEAMKEIHIDISNHHSKGIQGVDLSSFDLIVTLCDQEVCPVTPPSTTSLHLPHPDPGSTINSFREVRDQLQESLTNLLLPTMHNRSKSDSNFVIAKNP